MTYELADWPFSLCKAGFFPSGSAEVRAASIPVLSSLAATLSAGPLRIEGHTDNVPIHTVQFATNWELPFQVA